MILSEPTDWLEGQLLSLTIKLAMPLLAEILGDPTQEITFEDLLAGTFTAFDCDRLRLVRMMPGSRHAVCRHASGALVMVSSKHLTPITE